MKPPGSSASPARRCSIRSAPGAATRSRLLRVNAAGCGSRSTLTSRGYSSSSTNGKADASRRGALLGRLEGESGLDPAGELIDRGRERGYRVERAGLAPAGDIWDGLAADV